MGSQERASLRQSGPDPRGGRTVLLILQGCSTDYPGRLKSHAYAVHALTHLTDALELTPIQHAYVVSIPPGYSAVQMITESHIYLDTWPERAAVRLLVDSCKTFPLPLLVREADKLYAPARIDVYELQRTHCLVPRARGARPGHSLGDQAITPSQASIEILDRDGGGGRRL